MEFLLEHLEPIAVAFGLVSVFLSTRQHIASWPTAIANVSLYFVIFLRARLYANMGLQFVYLTLSVYGWYHWLHGGTDRSTLRVSRISARHALILGALVVSVGTSLGLLLSRGTDAALPWLDSALTACSLAAQWMMTRKLLESWLVWIVLDVVYVWMFVTQGLHATAVQYGVFLVLATMGFVEWRRSLRAVAAM